MWSKKQVNDIINNKFFLSGVVHWFLLIIIGLFGISNNLKAQCTSIYGSLIPNGIVQGDSIFLCEGDSLHIINELIDTSGSAVSQQWEVVGKGVIFTQDFHDKFSSSIDTVKFTHSNSSCTLLYEYYVFTSSISPKIWVNDTIQCLTGNQFIFEDSGNLIPGNVPVDSLKWLIDGQIYADVSNINFNNDSLHSVSYEVWTKGGCYAKDSINVSVLSSPEISIEYLTDTLFCYQKGINDTVKLKKTASLISSTGDSIVSSLWKINLNSYAADTFVYVFDPLLGGLYGDINFPIEVTASNGCKVNKTAKVHVVAPFQTSFFSSDTSVCEGTSITAYFNTVFNTRDPLYKREFKLTSNLTYTTTNNSFNFYPPDTGDFEVFVFETSTGKCRDTGRIILNSKSSPISLILGDKYVNCEGDQDTLFFSSFENDTVLNYNWFLSGNLIDTIPQFFLFKDSVGIEKLKLRISNNIGCESIDSIDVGISLKPDVSIKRYNSDSCVLGNQKFRILNSNPSNITAVQWYFHDSTTVNDSIANKTFTNSGNFNITAIATDQYGCLDTAILNVFVPVPPVSKFSVSSYQSCFGNQAFTYYDSSYSDTGQIMQRDWLFSDGYSILNDTIGSFSKNFNNPGTYTLTQIITNDLGCSDTSSDFIYVYPNPTADFSVNDIQQCKTNNLFKITNSSASNFTDSTLLYFWDFGDSSNSNQKSPNKSYNKIGNFKIKLKATSVYGCTDSADLNVLVKKIPEINLTVNNAIQCEDNNSFDFYDSSKFNGSLDSIFKTEWTLNGVTEIGKSKSYSFNTSGTYSVTMHSYGINGCFDSAVTNVSVLPKPVSKFSVSKDTQCLVGNVFQFNNQSTIISGGGNLTYTWDFGDSSNANSSSPSKTYNNYGKYPVKLVTTSQFGCQNAISKFINVISNPKVSFASLGGNAQCKSGNRFDFNNQTDSLNGSGLIYTWNFGDNTKSSLKNPIKSYTNPGVYTVKLITRNIFGCKDSNSQLFTIYTEPSVEFNINSNKQCEENNSFKVLNTSSSSYNGGNLNYKWFLDDSLISVTKNLNINSLVKGSYALKLLAINSNSCVDSMIENIQVLGSPSANFSINQDSQCLDGNKFEFQNSSFISGGNLSYIWNFGDSISSQLSSPSIIFENYGTYTITLVAYTPNGCKDTLSKNVLVHSTPEISFSSADTNMCLSGNEFIFNNVSLNPDGSSINFKWDFGDSTLVSTQNPTKKYTKSGNYFVRLVGQSAFGCIDSFVKVVTIFEQPYSSFSTVQSEQCFIDNNFEFINTSYIKGKNLLTYYWDFGNGTFDTVETPKMSYGFPGVFNVTLVVNSSDGCSDTTKSQMRVHEMPNINFDIIKTDTCLKANIINLKNNSVSNNASTLTYKWAFGDNNESVGDNPSHRYSTFDTFEIKLIGLTSYGCKDSAKSNVIIYPNPIADFTVNRLNQCIRGNNFKINNLSSSDLGNISSNWFFGDSLLNNVDNPSFTFDSVGNYSIKLFVVNEFGCIDTLKKNATTLPSPNSLFVVTDSIQCINGNKFIFLNNSNVSLGNLNFIWDYGDGAINKLYNGEYSYLNPGDYTVQLIAKTDNNCSDTSVNKVIVTPKPNVSFDINKYNQCLKSNSFNTSNNSFYNGSDSISFRWNTGDGGTYNSKNIFHTYSDYGKYKFQLIVESETGCKDSFAKDVEVYAQGKSEINIIRDSICLYNNEVRIGNNSRIVGDRFTSIEWIFGDGLNFITQSSNPIDHSYNDTGTYLVQLITTTNHLCKDSSSGNITILPNPTALVSSNTDIACLNEQNFEFSDISTFNDLSYTRSWIIGGKILGADSMLNYEFEEPGLKKVKLVATNIVGCTDTFNYEVLVNPSPHANFRINQRVQCLLENEFRFENTSTGIGLIPEGLWLPEPGSAAFENDLIYNYLNAGNYDVTLVTYNDSGCTDEITKNVLINPTPEAILSSNDICTLEPVTFNPNANISSGSIVQYDWNMGEGTFKNDTSPTYTYLLPAEYTVKLRLVSDKNCENRFSTTFNVHSRPTADFNNYTERPTILSPNVLLVDSSYDAWYWEWDFGDGSPFGLFYFEEHEYKDTGNFNVRLVAFSDFGCTDTMIKVIRIWPEYRLLFPTAFSPNNDGINDKYHIKGFHHSLNAVDIKIYSKNGILVYQSNDILDGWDGTYMNEKIKYMPSAPYELILHVKDLYGKQKTFTQKINLIR